MENIGMGYCTNRNSGIKLAYTCRLSITVLVIPIIISSLVFAEQNNVADAQIFFEDLSACGLPNGIVAFVNGG